MKSPTSAAPGAALRPCDLVAIWLANPVYRLRFHERLDSPSGLANSLTLFRVSGDPAAPFA
jgi:hypothetical protein